MYFISGIEKCFYYFIYKMQLTKCNIVKYVTI